MERRTLIRLLVGLGIGLPVAIEVATFLGLFRSRVGDDEVGEEGTPSPTPDDDETPPPDAVGVGDELLPATPQVDTVTAAEVQGEGGGRTFVMTVAVENDTDSGYELRLDALTTREGTNVPGGGRTDELEPGESGTVTGRWELPAGERPEAVIVVATVIGGGGERETVTRRVTLARVEGA